MITMQSEKFIIENDDYFGDFDLRLTLNSGQTSQPPWVLDYQINNIYWKIINIVKY